MEATLEKAEGVEMRQSVAQPSDEETGLDDVQTLADLLPVAAAQFRDAPAVIGVEQTYSFDEANRCAAAVARCLIAAGVGQGAHVGVLMHKTADSFVVVHAVLRAGAVLVPLDPLMPGLAAGTMMQTAELAAVIADHASSQRFGLLGNQEPMSGPAVFLTDGDHPQATSLQDRLDPSGSVDAALSQAADLDLDDPAYVIFTSGSTGVPKGTTHTHRSAMAYARLGVATHQISAEDRVAGLPPLHFDMSTLELYCAPLAGAAIVPIGTAELRFPASFTERAERTGITLWYSVPFQLRQISERGALDQRDMSALRHVIYAGEAFPVGALARLMRQLPDVRFSNAYGPAETNVVTVHEISEPPTGTVPIGRPWGDVEVVVASSSLDVSEPADLLEASVGDLGELWVKAGSVMAGYQGRPDLTAERVVGTGTDRWYRTGDLARRDEQGLLWLAGRIDHQLKVRGVRIELDAVEAVLTAHPQVADAVVAPNPSGSSVESLVAAVTLADAAEVLDQRSIRRWCSSKLTAVAVPTEFHVWDSLPLTSSGKIDRALVRTSFVSSDDDRDASSVGESVANGSPCA